MQQQRSHRGVVFGCSRLRFTVFLIGAALSLTALGACSDVYADGEAVGQKASEGDEKPAEKKPSPGGPPPSPVKAALVGTQTIADRRLATGSLRSRSVSEVAAKVAGRIKSVEFDQGDSVTSDAVVVRLDTSLVDARLQTIAPRANAERANLAVYDADIEGAKADLVSYLEANVEYPGSVSEITVREVRTRIARLEAQQTLTQARVKSIEAEEKELRVQQRDATVRAPFAGIVLMRHAEPGQWLNPGDPIISLAQQGDIEAVLEVDERIAMSTLKALTTLKLEIPALGRFLDSKSHKVIPNIDPRSRRYHVIATVAADADLAPGMSVRTKLPVENESERTVLHSDALMRDGEGYFVIKAAPPPPQMGGQGLVAYKIPVSLDFIFGEMMAIYPSALQPGDMVIVEGTERLFPMTPLKILNQEKLVPAGANETKE